MKYNKKWMLLCTMLITITAFAQQVNNCGFKIPPRSLATKFQSVYEARDIVKNMLDTIKWKENFTLREQNGINNAYATILQNKRWIVYDNDFLENLDSYAGTKWASISVMAHEMGHHYYNHVVSGQGSTIPTEIEADAFSGYMMNKLGATLDQSVAAMKTIATDRASSTHPAKADRINSITKGWNMGQNELKNTGPASTGGNGGNTNPGNTGNGNPNTGGNTGNTGTNTDPATDPSWIALSFQSTKDETVYLSDDGKTYQPAAIKAGVPFVFKFEVYNYGWLKLPYYNGARVFKLMHGKDYSIVWNRRTKNWTVVEIPE
jgi:Peptidase family M48